MRLIDIECVNVRTLGYFFHVFKPGLTGLLGPNGTGKTSFLFALCYGLTGTVLDNDTKKDLLKWGETKGYVKITFEDSGKIYIIKRNIQGSSVDLREKDAPKPLYALKEDIDIFMKSLIGLHPRLYDKVIFIEQEKLDEVPMSKHPKRVDFFNDLFDASITDKLREYIQSYIQLIPVFPDTSQEKADLYARLSTEREQIGALTVNIDKMTTALADLPSLETLAAWSAKPLQSVIDDGIKRHKDMIVLHKGTIKKHADITMPAFITPEREGNYQQYVNMRVLEQTVKEAKEKLAAVIVPITTVKESAAELNGKKLQITEKLRLCEMGKCPTCGNEYRDAPKEQLIKEQQLLEAMGAELQEHLNGEALKADAERSLKEGEERLQAYIKRMPNEVLAFDEIEYLDDKAAIATQSIQIDEYRQLEYEATEAAKRIKELEAQISDLEKAEGVTEKDKEHYRTLSATAREVQDKKQSLEIEKQGLTTSVSICDQRVQAILKEEAQNQKYIAYKKVLERCREVLHRECLPQIRVSAGLTMLNAKMTEWLDVFDVPFTVRIDKSCDFVISKNGAVEKPFKSLSGGQRKVGAMAFRLAIAEIFGSALGVLALDEPTAYMDVDAKRNLVEVLIRAESHAIAKNMNVFIPTHEEVLMTAFTETINMVDSAA